MHCFHTSKAELSRIVAASCSPCRFLLADGIDHPAASGSNEMDRLLADRGLRRRSGSLQRVSPIEFHDGVIPIQFDRDNREIDFLGGYGPEAFRESSSFGRGEIRLDSTDQVEVLRFDRLAV